MRFVPTKTAEQQSGLVLHRARHLFVRQQTSVINAIRAHLAEFGIVAPVGRHGVEELLDVVTDPNDKRVPDIARACLSALGDQLKSIKQQILEFDRLIRAWHRSNEMSMRLEAASGVGLVLATALVAAVADPKSFRSGRNFSAWIGMGPKQHSSGGKNRLGKAFMRRLSKFARVIMFDKRGQGLSDRISGAPSLEDRMDDVRAIMDEIGSRSAALIAFSEGGALSIVFAATYPERVSHLILFGCFACFSEMFENPKERIEVRYKNWGTGVMMSNLLPSLATDPEMVQQLAKLPNVRVPTLVLHRKTDRMIPAERGRELAAKIPGAKYIEYPDGDH